MTDTAAPDGLVAVEWPRPSGGLIIDVAAAGVGYPDVLMRRGMFQIPQELPFVLGWEAAGTVRHAPEGSAFTIGDRVVTMSFGAFADQVVGVEQTTFVLPESIGFDVGAALPLNYLTGVAAMRRGRVEPGERVLVTAASGGLGSAIVQLAVAGGAEVIATASSDEKAEHVRSCGASDVIRTDDNWLGQLAAIGTFDVAFDLVGGDVSAAVLRQLAGEGRLVVLGFLDGTIPTIKVNRLLFNNTDVCGCTWSVLEQHDGGYVAAFESGTIQPPVTTSVGFDELGETLNAIETRRSLGKAVLRTR